MPEDTAHTAEVAAYLDRLYDGEKRAFACRARTPEELDAWQKKACPALRHLLGLEEINLDTMGHKVCAELDPVEEFYVEEIIERNSGPEFAVLATNTLEDGFDASPAVVGGEIYLRGRQFLYCIAAN